MLTKNYEDLVFKNQNFQKEPLSLGQYENCLFKNCNFQESALKDFLFVDCEFTNCDLSNLISTNTSFNNVQFSNCKMLGYRFDVCNPFGFFVSFDQCILNYASFYQLNIAKTIFKKCQLLNVDFTECNAKKAIFKECDLKNSQFHQTNLQEADLSSAFNFSINPTLNIVKKAKFSQNNIDGLLNDFQIIIKK